MQYIQTSQSLLFTKKANDFKAADRMNYSVSNVDKAANVVLISLSEYNTLTKDNLTLTKPMISLCTLPRRIILKRQ